MPSDRTSMVGRRRIRGWTPWLLALLFGAFLTPIVVSDNFLIPAGDYSEGAEAPLTVRIGPFQDSDYSNSGGAIAIARGQVLGTQEVDFVAGYAQATSSRLLTTFVSIALLLLAWSATLRQTHQGSFLRQQLVSLGWLTLFALIMKALLLLTSISILATPVAVTGLLIGRRSPRSVAIPTALLTALVVSALAPLDAGVVVVLVIQAVLPSLLLRRNSTFIQTVEAVVATALASAVAFVALYLAVWNILPAITPLLHGTWFAALTGALSAGVLALLLRPCYSGFVGEVSGQVLKKLALHSQPILQQIAQRSPGTWEHSLTMANLAVASGTCIGADTDLLRVGAYYHDLGKSVNPKRFAENIEAPEDPDSLDTIESRDADFAHIIEGVRIAQGAGLPERVVDFIRSHHGDAVAVGLWSKAQAVGKSNLRRDDFRYPGVRPQCQETGIVSICEAIEATSQNVGPLTEAKAAELIAGTIAEKVQAGQLSECGLSLDDLSRLSNALTGALVAARAGAEMPSTDAIVSREDTDEPPVAESLTAAAEMSEEMGAPATVKIIESGKDSFSRITARRDIDSQPTTERPVVVLERATPSLTAMGVPARPFTDDEITAKTPEPKQESELPITIPMVKRDNLAAWTQALDEARVRPGIRALAPPIHSAPSALLGKKRDTIPLGENSADSSGPTQRAERASSQDGMQPGEMVLGAPPGTHPERTEGRTEEVTALRPLPVPDEARRPEDRITEEQLAFIPPEAFPETQPDAKRPVTEEDTDPDA